MKLTTGRRCMFPHNYNVIMKKYEAYKSQKTQKASIKEELMPIAWHPSRWWDWFIPEDEKKETEKKFFDHLICALSIRLSKNFLCNI